MKRKHCFDSVGRGSVSGDAAGDTGRGYPVREWNDTISHPEERQWSLRRRGVSHSTEVWPLPHVEFSARPGPAVVSLSEPARGRGSALCRNRTQESFIATHHDDSLMRFWLDKITRRLGQTRVIVRRERFKPQVARPRVFVRTS